MTFAEFVKSWRKRAVLLFLAGFFFGGILYYLCQEPAAESLASMEEKMAVWAGENTDFWKSLLFIIWERGKVFSLLWLIGYTKLYKGYILVFITYVGMQSGFMLTFFLVTRGVKGLLHWTVLGTPQVLFLVPLYVYSFYYIFERRRKKAAPAAVFWKFVFLFCGIFEAKVNMARVRWVYGGGIYPQCLKIRLKPSRVDGIITILGGFSEGTHERRRRM